MTTNPNPPVPHRDDDREEPHMLVVLLGLTAGLPITGTAVYLARVHPAPAEPLQVGAAVLTALAGLVSIVMLTMRTMRRR